ncbi:Diguanylate cyclase [Sphingobium herbicidovorans NBRC 16415]|uniref:diguanylate cyclase n=1 Tax=Sphingobium herbicidovorans (strain ATCC 700291 / DSM 11019 / CCUG 56400 / KCTC 2939 / LMG 18315 / NBRC 16415 / MH) TaxID=1219045 RepID=A0A086PBM7_SPHHM|nr:Diguanylate cyclase [Sphingobium herbicidovorans NBRC 16415]
MNWGMCVSSHLPGGRLAAQLEALSREGVWLAIVAGTAVVAFLDYHMPAAGMTSVYIVIICGASWGLGAREGYFVAANAAFLSAASAFQDGPLTNPDIIMRVGIRVVAFLFLAATITSFRRSYDRQRFLAHHDPMTRVLNKEAFEQRAQKLIDDAACEGIMLLLIVLDLDDFKSVNSRGGHQAGDEVIRKFAAGLLAARRKEDLVGRIGGDEFSYLTRVASAKEGADVASSLHACLTAVLAKGRYPVTCSLGVQLIAPGGRQTFKQLTHAADFAMYDAKRAGKDRVRSYETERSNEINSPPDTQLIAEYAK